MKIIPKPDWLKKKININENESLKKDLADLRLHTICEEALCPNISECFKRRQATFLIMGNLCTRACSFCNVDKSGQPLPLEYDEPKRTAEAVKRLGLRHAVITSPTRDDLSDGGASHFIKTVEAVRSLCPETKIEILVPDFGGIKESIINTAECRVDIYAHNLETVPSLYHVRKGADYKRSLALLKTASEAVPNLKVKSGLMLGMGEGADELSACFAELLENGCRYLSLGQYLPPSKRHYPVKEYISPRRFDELKEEALSMGFVHVESGPYVRSSYHAEEYINE